MKEHTIPTQNIVEKRKKIDYKLSAVVCWRMISLFLINAVDYLGALIGLDSNLVSNGAKLVMVILIVMNLKNIYKRFNIQLLMFLLLMTIIVLINYLFSSNNIYFEQTIQDFALNTMPIFVVVMCIENYEQLLDMLIKISGILIASSFFLMLMAGSNNGTYSMGLANSLGLPIILVLYDYYKTRKKYKFGIVIFGCLTIIMIGSRGVLLGIGFYAIALLCKGLVSNQNRAKSICFILVILIALIFYNQIVEILIGLARNLNINSRTLYLLQYERTHDSGRNVIYEAILDEIRNHPFRLRGIAGEYAITHGAFAHNFILELLCDFGIVFGGGTVIWTFFNLLRTLNGAIFRNESGSLLIFMASSVPMLFVSGSIWTTTYFWIWIALILNKKKLTVRKMCYE